MAWPPLLLTPVPTADIERGDGPDVCDALETLCTIGKDGFAGKQGDPIVLREWQRELIYHLYARRPDGRRRHRTALIGMPRKNSKSTMGSGFALDGLLFDGNGAEVYSAAADKEQARIVFGETRKMIERQPSLSAACRAMRDVIEVPSTGSIYRCLSSEAFTKEGLNVSRCIYDELHAQPNDDLWNVLTLASAARIDPLVIAITTAGVMSDSTGRDSVCYRLWQYGRDIAEGRAEDPTFFMAWWGAPTGADHRDPEVWKAANPAYGDLIDPEDLESACKRTPEGEFQTKRLNMWVSVAEAWFPAGVFEGAADPRELPDGAEVVLGVDASYSHDATVVALATVEEKPYVDIVWAWERPEDAGDDWTIAMEEVEDAIRDACRRYKVREIVFDHAHFERTAEILERERVGTLVNMPQTNTRMIPATARFYQGVVDGLIKHSGHDVLVRHVRNATTKITPQGVKVVKDTKGSPRKIDAAIAAVMAVSRAQELKPRKPRIIHLADVVT